jgi:hypothetical protein
MTLLSKSLTEAITVAQTFLRLQGDKSAITAALIAEKVKLAAEAVEANGGEPVDQEAAVRELVRRYSRWIGKDTTLSDREGHLAWLDTARKGDWRYWPRYEELIARRLAPDVVSALDASTDGVLGLLEDPRREGRWDRRGLVVGHVQSGKTGNYSGLVCKAADAGYKIIVVLAGLHNNLRAQTQIRMEESFLGYETSANRDPGKATGVGEIDSDPSINPNCVTTRAENGDFNTRAAANLAITPESRPWLFVVKKQKTVLTQLLRWIQGHVADHTDPATGRKSVKRLPILVIDDEADHASVDTGEQKFDADGTPLDEYQPKTINRLIRQLLNAFDKRAYVGYTATPFANIFIHRKNATAEEGPDLFPQAFIRNLAAPSNYMGPARVFGLRTPAGREGGLPLPRKVADHLAADGHDGWMPSSLKKTHVPTYKGQETLPPSLNEAIGAFLLACAARELRGQAGEHMSMLVHVTRFTDVQELVREQVEAAVKRIRQKLTRRVDHEALTESLRKLWESDFQKTSATVTERMPEPDGPPLMPSWDQIVERLPDLAGDIEVRIINGTARDALDYAEQGRRLRVIAIGGDKLARGLTLDGLCVSYFVRTTKMYDTLMQMGRWFGYRPGYADLCRLYTSSDLIEWFGHIADAAEELREEFDAMAASGGTPLDYGLKVQSHPVLLVTSPLKMRTAKSLQLSFSGDLVETVALHNDPAKLDQNLAAFARLVSEMGPPRERDRVVRQRGEGSSEWKGFLWDAVGHELVVDFLGRFETHPKARKVNSALLAEFISSMAQRGELTKWTVALIGGGEGKPWPLPGGLQLDGALQRKAERGIDDRYSIGRLLSPRDEAIDLDNAAWLAALRATRSAWKPDPARQRGGNPQTEPDSPNGPAIRRVRGRGAEGVTPAPERGLLLLYLLDPAKSESPQLVGRTDPIVAFGISFPSSDAGVKVEYKVDHLLYAMEYGPAD